MTETFPADPISQRPAVSVGLPVFNGEPYLEDSIRSILCQSFTNLELIICDNASTDRTEEICRSFCAIDSRVRYVRGEQQINAAANHNRVFASARGKYFRWAGDDDLVDSRLIEKAVQVLDSNPGTVLCHSQVIEIDAESTPMGTIRRDRFADDKVCIRFKSIIDLAQPCDEMYGLIRHSALVKTELIQPYTDSDRALLAHLALLGAFYEIPEPLFLKRRHPGSSVTQHADWRERMLFYDPKYATEPTMPHWLQLFHLLRVIRSPGLAPSVRRCCYVQMARWPWRYRKWRSLLKDLWLASTFSFRQGRFTARTR